MTITRTALATGLLSMAFAGQVGYRSWPISQAPENMRRVAASADLIVVEMHGVALRELEQELNRRGPVDDASFCHLDATAALNRVAAREGIAAGRTSDRLRNPANAPRPWAAPIVSAHAGRAAKTVEGFVVDLGDKVGVLRPIVERAMCASCHGPDDRLASGLKIALKQRYPQDRAIGFHEGEIRGWFWVEMPKQPR